MQSFPSRGHRWFLALLVVLVPLLCVPVSAAPATSQTAATLVRGWLRTERKPLGETMGNTLGHVETYRDAAGQPLYHVVELLPSGFVLVSGDDAVEPIIAFAPQGRFEPSASNPLGALVSRDLPNRIAAARSARRGPSGTAAARAQARWGQLTQSGNGDSGAIAYGVSQVLDVRVAPLTQSTWGQQTAGGSGTPACYNYYTPPYGDGNAANYPAGCVATAMAQLMRYHQFPTTSIGMVPFSIQVDGMSSTYYTRGGDGAGGPYAWSNMPLVPSSSPTVAQAQAIGALVADAGGTVNMQYSASGSSSVLLDAKTALVNTFHYFNAVQGWNNNADLGSGLLAMLNPNLDAHYPVLLGIQGASGGHAVVADGYGYMGSTLYHHLNLGWSGSETAWYTLPLVDTTPYTYTVVDSCVYNLYPSGSGEIISGRVLDQISRPVANATVTATRSGGGTYIATTDSQGIYALARIPANSTYSLSVTKPNYSPASGNFSTGHSTDRAAASGNHWGANFTLNMLTTAVDHLVWSPIPSPESLNTPFPVTITALNLTNGPATGFTGPVALSAFMSGVGSLNTVIGNLTPNAYRTSSSSDMSLGYAFTLSTNLQVTAVRSYMGDKVSIWTDGGTLLVTQGISGAVGSWTETALPSPLALSAGGTYRVSIHVPAGAWGYTKSPWPSTFPSGSVGQNLYRAFGDVFPGQAIAVSEGPLVDLRYQVVFSNSIPISPSSSGTFVNGAWNGNVSVSQVSANVTLKADDGAGHTAFSSPFNVVDPNAAPPVITTQPQNQTNNSGENATFSLVATSTQTPTYIWRRNGTPIGAPNAPSYTLANAQLSDSGSQFSCIVSNNYGAVTSQTATLTVRCTNVLVAAQPQLTLNPGGTIYAVAPLPDGTTILGGYFTNINSVARKCLVRLLPNGSLDLTWNPAPNGAVLALAVSGTNLYVGGAFTAIGSQNRGYIARLSTSGTGAADPTWNPSANDWVQTLAVTGFDVYAGGWFTIIGGQYCNCIAKLNALGSGVADPSWNPNPSISGDYPVVDVITTSGTDVFVGGYFTQIGGLPRNCVAKLSNSNSGLADPAWNPSAYGEVLAIALSGTNAYLGGAFNTVGALTRNYLAKVGTTGTGAPDLAWNPNADAEVKALTVQGLYVYAGGAFTNVGGLHRERLAKLSAGGTGAADSTWDAAPNDVVQALALGSTSLFVGGNFTQLGGQPRAGLASLSFAPLVLGLTRAGGAFQGSLSGERGQAFEIQASTNFLDWTAVCTVTNSLGTTSFTDPGANLSKRFYRARLLQ